jgi:hypothetical protein
MGLGLERKGRKDGLGMVAGSIYAADLGQGRPLGLETGRVRTGPPCALGVRRQNAHKARCACGAWTTSATAKVGWGGGKAGAWFARSSASEADTPWPRATVHGCRFVFPGGSGLVWVQGAWRPWRSTAGG